MSQHPPARPRTLTTTLGEIPKRVWALLLAETVFRFSFFGVVGVFAQVATDAQLLSDTQAAIAFNLFYAAVWLCCVPGGWLVDSVQRPGLVALGGGGFYFLGLWLFAWNVNLAVPALCLFALGFGCLRPLLGSLIGDQFVRGRQDDLRVAFLAWSYVATNLGALFGFLLAPAFQKTAGDVVTARILGVAGLAAAVLVFLTSPWLRVIPAEELMPRRAAAGVPATAQPLSFSLLIGILFCVACFWLVYNRTHDHVLAQARDVAGVTEPDDSDRPEKKEAPRLILVPLVGWRVTPAQFQSLNPLFIIFLTAPLRRRYPDQNAMLAAMLVGFYWMIGFIAFTSLLQLLIALKQGVSLWALVVSYGLASVAEIFLAVAAINYFYHVSRNHRALAMGLFYASIGIGEVVGIALNSYWGWQFPSQTAWTKVWYFLVLGMAAVFATGCFFVLRRQNAAQQAAGGAS